MTPQEIARTVFGVPTLRSYQERIIAKLLEKKNVVAVLPTSAGKSLCYQVPSLLFPGLTIVISPLLALMRDQVESLRKLNIQAECWNSETPPEHVTHIQEKLRQNQLSLLYLSPEKLVSEPVRRTLLTTTLSHICIDEAHCISQWGHDFRPEYLQIATFLQQYAQHNTAPVVSAFTATATLQTLHDVIKQLDLTHPDIVTIPLFRPNLRPYVVPCPSNAQKLQLILKVLTWWLRKGTGKALLYAATRKEAETLQIWLQSYGFTQALVYHAGLTAQQRQEYQALYQKRRRSILVATTAFGMGVNIPDIRLVIHSTPPTSLEAYSQEIGRAGRDGLESLTLLCYRSQDLQRNLTFVLEGSTPSRHQVLKNQALAMERFALSSGCFSQKLAEAFRLPQTPSLSFRSCRCSNCSQEVPWAETTPPPQLMSLRAQALFQQLKYKRKQKADQLKIPKYFLATDAVLKTIALETPRTWKELKRIGGVGHRRLWYWGKDVLRLTARAPTPKP